LSINGCHWLQIIKVTVKFSIFFFVLLPLITRAGYIKFDVLALKKYPETSVINKSRWSNRYCNYNVINNSNDKLKPSIHKRN